MALTLATTLAACGGGEAGPDRLPPSPSLSVPSASPSAEASAVLPAPWLNVQPCAGKPGVFTLPRDPDHLAQCQEGNALRRQLIERQPIEIWKAAVPIIGNTGVSICVAGPIVLNELNNGQRLAAAKVGEDSKPDVLVFDIVERDVPQEAKSSVVASPDPRGIYLTRFAGKLSAVGILMDEKFCK